MANIKEVAKAAGVSVATISRVLNHPETVLEETKKHVLAIMEELSYKPNSLARGLALNRTNTIALLIPDILNPKFMEIAKGVEDVAHSKGYNILLCNTEGVLQKEKEYIEIMKSRRVDGIILANTLLEEKDMKIFQSEKFPVVSIGKVIKNINIVYIDDFKAAYEATNHLIEIGYKEIGFLSGPLKHYENITKKKGYEKALQNSGIDIKKEYCIEGESDINGGYISSKRLIKNNPKLQAIFVANDLMAIAALDAIKSEGLRVPEDIAVVGFDNISMAALVEPKLTTIAEPIYKMGLVASRILLEQIETPDEHFPQQILLQTKLKVRQSCGYNNGVKRIFD